MNLQHTFVNHDEAHDSHEHFMTDAFRVGASKRSKTREGFLMVKDCVLTTVGVFTYLAADFQPHAFNDKQPLDTIRVYRAPDEMFNRDSMDSFAGVVMTNNHPPNGDMINQSNVKRLQVGHLNGGVKKKDNSLVGDLIVTDASTIREIEAGKEQLSNGYYSKYDFNAGKTPDGENFDCRQIMIRGNHISLVLKGRAGSECRVTDESINQETPMETVTINGVSYEASKQVVQAVGVLQGNLSDVHDQLANIPNTDAAIATATTALQDEHKAVVDTKDAEIKDLQGQVSNMDAAVDIKLAVIAGARKLDPKFVFTNKDTAAIRRESVAAVCKDITNLGECSEEYISARFDAEVARCKTPSTLDTALATTDARAGEDGKSETEKAREKRMLANQDAWKTK